MDNETEDFSLFSLEALRWLYCILALAETEKAGKHKVYTM
jgi:hypothetical protein